MCDKQCSAPLNGKRCPNLTVNPLTFHCKDHIEEGITLYNKYKTICDELDLYSVDRVKFHKTIPEKIKYLHKYYCLCIRAYKGRRTHRDFAFVPELRHDGHETQFNIITQKITEVEDKLRELYDELQIEPVTLEKKDREPIQITMEKVKRFKKKRINDGKLTDTLLDKYIRENEKIKDNTLKVINRCIDLLTLFCPVISDHFKYPQLFGIYHLLSKIDKMGYFSSEYKHDEYYFYTVNISCRCIANHTNMQDFLCTIPIDSLKVFYQTINQNVKKIKNVCVDYNNIWKQHGIEIMNMNLHMVWDPAFNRLCLKIDDQIGLTSGRRHFVQNCELVKPNWHSQDTFLTFINSHTTKLRVMSIQDAMKHMDLSVLRRR